MKQPALVAPTRAVTEVVQRDGAFFWALECGHFERIGRKPAQALYRECSRCLIDHVTQKRTETSPCEAD